MNIANRAGANSAGANWAGNVTYAAARTHEPGKLDELRRTIAGLTRGRAIGARHSFSTIADTTGDHVSLASMRRVLAIDPAQQTVRVEGGATYADVAPALHAAGFALHNLASLSTLSIAGACATATHGSGVANGNLATAVRRLRLVVAGGDVLDLDRTDPRFSSVVVGLGSFGIVAELTLAIEPTFTVSQRVYERLPLAAACERFDDVMGSAYSVSLFTTWREPVIDQMWREARTDRPAGAPWPDDDHGARPAARALHPIAALDLDAGACTAQLGAPGPWHERLPHFRADATPSAGAELQSELFIDRVHAADALRTLAGLATTLAPAVLVSEIRTVAADDLVLSPCDGRDAVAFHFTWVPSWADVEPVLARVEAALAPFAPRPHWGKLTTLAPDAVRVGFPRFAEAERTMRALDPSGVFRDAFVDRVVG